MLHDHHHLLSLDFRRCADDGKFVLQLGSLRFVTGRGFLASSSSLSSPSSSLSLALLHVASQHVHFHVLDDSSSSAIY